jgi:hypothetical protein
MNPVRAGWLLPWLLVAPLAAAQPRSEVVLPGSQPPEIVTAFSLPQDALVPFLPSDVCASCHTNAAEPAGDITRGWRGSMMANASRDPLTWAALAVAERDAPGIGDTCLRCHVPQGWIQGRSVPSNGSMLLDSDADGVTCLLCHRLAEPSGAEPGLIGAQASSFSAAGPACGSGDGEAGVACDVTTGAPCSGGATACRMEPFHGNAMMALFQDATTPGGISRLGPYANPFEGLDSKPHNARQSLFLRDGALCGTCHDVSNPVTGDLAPGNGRLVWDAAQGPIGQPLPAEAFSGVNGGPVMDKAGLRNPPYAYGPEQRTYSEWVASAWPRTPVSAFASLPSDLQAAVGAPAKVAAAAAATGGAYDDGTLRAFTCQSCHLPPTAAAGCALSGALVRPDLPAHDLTGGNTFAPLAILYLDGRSRLHLGGGLTQDRSDAIRAAAQRAAATLASAVSLELENGPTVLANTVRVVNLTGHKLFTGYPDGRRMWLNVVWRDENGVVLREDGAYGDLPVQQDLDGDGLAPDVVETLLDPTDPHTRVYQAEAGISQAWAKRLRDVLEVPADLPLAYDRITGAVEKTLGELADAPAGTVFPTFHLALDDVLFSDDRIPPYGMAYTEARKRNALPVPASLYLADGQTPGDGAVYQHYDRVTLAPPDHAARATITLYYQTTSWEYVQFLWKANAKADPFLATVGDDLLEAWRETAMAQPIAMKTVSVPEPDGAAGVGAAVLALSGLGAGFGRRARRGLAGTPAAARDARRSVPGGGRVPARRALLFLAQAK